MTVAVGAVALGEGRWAPYLLAGFDGVAFDQAHTTADAFDNGGFVGRGVGIAPGGVGVADGVQTESLRRLGAPQAFAVDTTHHQVIRAATQAVGHE